MARAFWRHSTSGDIYAVETNEDGKAWAAVGPLYYTDVTDAYLADLDVSTEEETAAMAGEGEELSTNDMEAAIEAELAGRPHQ